MRLTRSGPVLGDERLHLLQRVEQIPIPSGGLLRRRLVFLRPAPASSSMAAVGADFLATPLLAPAASADFSFDLVAEKCPLDISMPKRLRMKSTPSPGDSIPSAMAARMASVFDILREEPARSRALPDPHPASLHCPGFRPRARCAADLANSSCVPS